jgi:hypothetical protein
MNALQKDQKLEISYPENSPVANAAASLMRRAAPIGVFAGPIEFVVRFQNGELVPADTGSQGGGQN